MLKLSSRNNELELAGSPRRKLKKRRPFRRGLESSRLFLGLIVLTLIGLVGWSSFAKIDQVVRVEGKVIPSGKNQQIQHLEGGIVASISTSEGATVRRGDLLMTIDDTTAGANLNETRVKLDAQKARIARLKAEVGDKPTPDFPADIRDASALQGEKELFAERRAKLDGEIAVQKSVIEQRTADITEADKRRAQLTEELTTAHQRVDIIQNMAARGVASKLEILEAQSREERLKTELSEIEGAIPKAKAAIAESQTRITGMRADFHASAQNDLVTSMSEAQLLEQSITAAKDRLNRTDIRAPIDGTINRISVNTVGGVVKPGETLIELTPTTSQIQIEAKAQPRDRGHLRPGLDAEIRISAYDTAEYGMLKGRVTEVSSDSMQPDGRQEPYYQVVIRVDDVPPQYTTHPMIPGMTATADIVTGQRTMLSYLTSPLHKFTYNMFRDPK